MELRRNGFGEGKRDQEVKRFKMRWRFIGVDKWNAWNKSKRGGVKIYYWMEVEWKHRKWNGGKNCNCNCKLVERFGWRRSGKSQEWFSGMKEKTKCWNEIETY